MRHNKALPVALTIAGSDSGGGAGIQADLKTFSAHNVYGATAITCLTAQNPDSVTDVFPVPSETVVEQIRQADRFFPLQVIKTGMLFSEDIIRAVGDFLEESDREYPIVVDPVMVATSGAVLLQADAIEALCESVLPYATLITPNLDEAAVFLGELPESDTMADAAVALARDFGTAVLLKGGHLLGNEVWDVFSDAGGNVTEWNEKRIDHVDTHGSGCTLAAAIAARIAHGDSVRTAVETSRAYLRSCLLDPVRPGIRPFINHFPAS